MITKIVEYRDEFREDVIEIMIQSRLFYQQMNHQEPNPPSRDAILENIKNKTKEDNNRIRALVVDDRVAGVAMVEVTTSVYNSNLKIGNLSNLFILEDFRGKGLSRIFISDMESELRSKGCKKIRLSVNINNENAHRVYKKLGYTDDSIGMLKKL